MKKSDFRIRWETWKNRPFSWSQMSSFFYDPEQWYENYFLGKRSPPNAEMLFGKKVGDRLAKDPDYLPHVPRLDTFEHKLQVNFKGIMLVGYADSFNSMTRNEFKEYKTGVKEWDEKRVREHGQIDMYLLMHWITEKIHPDDIDCELVWLPTKRKETGDFKVTISFVEPIKKSTKIFKANRTMKDILSFGEKILRTIKEMEQYAKKHD